MVVEPTFRPAARDQAALLRRALRAPVAGPPLASLVAPGPRVALAVCDGTRSQPARLMVLAILDELEGIVADEDVIVLVATGTHHGARTAHLFRLYGASSLTKIVKKYLIVIEETSTGFSASRPNLAGCVATGATQAGKLKRTCAR